MASVTVTTSPTTLDAAASTRLMNISNTGPGFVTLSSGAKVGPGQATQVLVTAGIALTATTGVGTAVVTVDPTPVSTPAAPPAGAPDYDPAGSAAAVAAALPGTYAPLPAAKFGTRRTLPRRSQVDVVMASPPTVGALATATAIVSAIAWKPVGESGGSTALQTSRYFAYTQGAAIAPYGTSSPNSLYVTSNSITGATNDTKMPSIGYEFEYSGAGALELLFKGITSFYRLWVDGELVASAATSVGNTGSVYFLPVTFAARGQHRIRLDSTGVFGGVMTGPTDSVWAPEVRGPRVIVMGDSYTAGTGSNGDGVTNWVRKMASALGWPDVWSSGIGGTGYINPGGGGTVKFGDRVAADVIAYAPDLVIWEGGHNDTASSAAAVQAAAAACFAQVAAALPSTRQIVLGVLWNSGVEAVTTAVLDTDAALQTAAVVAGLPFIPFLTGPTDNAGSTTLSAQASSGATTVSVAAVFTPIRSTVEIDTGAARERRIVTNISGVGPYTYTLNAALSATHASGAAVTAVGANFWTGTGKVGTTTGVGNCDVIVSSDGTHLSQEGHDQLGLYVADQIAGRFLAA